MCDRPMFVIRSLLVMTLADEPDRQLALAVNLLGMAVMALVVGYHFVTSSKKDLSHEG